MGTSGAAVWVETPLALGLAVTASVSGPVDGLVSLGVGDIVVPRGAAGCVYYAVYTICYRVFALSLRLFPASSPP